jgi:PleD family two-component response regulator
VVDVLSPLAVEPPLHQAAATQWFPTTPLRILIVDDNLDSADMIATLLQFAGHETLAAHDGSAAGSWPESAPQISP